MVCAFVKIKSQVFGKLVIFTILSLLYLNFASANIIINEIMADPTFNDYYNEWIELYNNGDELVNLTDWMIGDSNYNDTIEGNSAHGNGTLIIPPKAYIIITDKETAAYYNFNITRDAIKLYVDDYSIGNGLSNDDGETIYLYDNNFDLIDQVTYPPTDEGYSYSYFNGTWLKSDATPGYSNNGSLIGECDFKVEILLNKTIFEEDEFEFTIYVSKLKGNKTNVTLFREIRNAYNEIEESYNDLYIENVLNHRTYTYSPNLLENNAYIINTTISTICNDNNVNNNYDSKTIFIEGGQLNRSSSLEILDIEDLGSDKIAKWGQIIKVSLNVYKGDTEKYSITARIEDNNGEAVTKQSKSNVYTKYTSYELSIPIQIDPNCKETYLDGSYNIVVEGLDDKQTKEIRIADITTALCEKVYSDKVIKKSYEGLDLDILEVPEEANINDDIISKVKIYNNSTETQKLDVWSYVYRGSKSYSGFREENMQEVTLPKKTSVILELKNNINDDIESGEYKYKINFKKQDRKTPQDFTSTIYINSLKENKENVTVSTKTKDGSLITGMTIYESTDIKAKKAGIYIFSIVLIIILVYFVKKSKPL